MSRSAEFCNWNFRSHSCASRFVANPRLHFCLRSPFRYLSQSVQGQTEKRLTSTTKNALSHEFLPTAKGVIIWIYFSHLNRLQIILPPTNHLTVRIIALKRLLSICYQKTFPKPENPHKHWIY